MPILRAWTGTPLTSFPSISTWPRSSETKPAMARSRVVLPLPLGPSRPKNSPSLKVMVTPSKAAIAPYFFTASVTATVLMIPSPFAAEAIETRGQQQRAHRHHDDDGRDGVDLRREALADGAVDLHRQRGDAGRRQEIRDDELVERDREREQGAADHARRQQRRRHAPERLPGRRAQSRRRLLHRARKGRQPRADHHDHVGQRQGNVPQQNREQAAL